MRGDFADPDSRDSKRFRRRFRIPHKLYLALLDLANEWFSQKLKDAMGRPVTPIELKLLSTLRILERSCPYDAVAELTDISENICISEMTHQIYS